MQIVVLCNMQGDVASLAQKLATVLGVTPYEARNRINVSAGGLAVIASFNNVEQTTACLEMLHASGFSTLTVDSTTLETDNNRFIVKQLNFGTESLQLNAGDGRQLTINYIDMVLLLRGAGIISNTQSETTTKKKFAVGRALASGGLVMRKKVTTTTTTVNDERQPFCHIYTANSLPIVLRQDTLDYTCLGNQRQLSREANFNWVCSELRRLASNARWDDRLQTKASVAQLLGPVFKPESDLDLAITIVVRSYLAS